MGFTYMEDSGDGATLYGSITFQDSMKFYRVPLN